jgi:hypothetical protein
MRADTALLVKLGDAFSQINSPVGKFGLETLAASTKGLASKSAGDATYQATESALEKWGSIRDTLVPLMEAELYGAAFGGHALNVREAKGLIEGASILLKSAAEG